MKRSFAQLLCVGCLSFCTVASSFAVEPAGTTMFWNEVTPGAGPGGNSALNELKRLYFDGGSPQTISTNTTSRLTELAFEPSLQKLYWSVGNYIKRANPDGSNEENIVTTFNAGQPSGMYGLGLDAANATMYWTDFLRRTIERSGLDGSNRVVVFNDNNIQPGSLALDLAGSRLFFEHRGDGGAPEGPKDKISFVNLNGSGLQTIITGLVQLNGIAIDPVAQKLYYVDLGFNALNDTVIRRANLDGSGVETLLSNLPDVIIDIYLDPMHNAMYWSSRDEGLIKKSTLNGTNVQTVLSGLHEPHAVLIVPEPATAALFLTGGAMLIFQMARVRRRTLG
jgi:hypothetical protein